jgi:DNA-binding CsgD family transcriptional regulator
VLGSFATASTGRERALADGYRLVEVADVPPAPWNLERERIVATGVLRSRADAVRALYLVSRGCGLVVELALDPSDAALLLDDLHRLRPDLPVADPLAELTEIDRDLIRLLASGASVTSAAGRLFISRRTADRRLARLRAVAGASSNPEAVAWFASRGIGDP